MQNYKFTLCNEFFFRANPAVRSHLFYISSFFVTRKKEFAVAPLFFRDKKSRPAKKDVHCHPGYFLSLKFKVSDFKFKLIHFAKVFIVLSGLWQSFSKNFKETPLFHFD